MKPEPYKLPKEIVIRRDEWMRGTGQSLLLDSTKKQCNRCCIGIALQQCEVPDDLLYASADVTDLLIDGFKLALPREFINDEGREADWLTEAYKINDNEDSDPRCREQFVRKLLSKNLGIAVRIVGRTPKGASR